MVKMKACPVCGQKVGIDKLEGHIKRVHPREKVELELDEEEEKEVKATKKTYKPISRPKGRWIVLVAVIVIIIVVLAFVLVPRGLKVGDTPPDFTLNDTNGTPWNLDSHIRVGKPILLEFMHPQCSFCIQEVQIPTSPLRSLYNSFSTRIELISIAVTLEEPTFINPPTLGMVNDFKNNYSTLWTYLIESSGTHVRDIYEVKGTPNFILIGTNGKIAYIQRSGGGLDDIIAELNKELTP